MEQKIVSALETNYMPYTMSVIISRAIPEIDGFKPAHRKLLYTMYKMGLLTGNRIKSTDVVGQTMKLNPHGDQAIYETLVRLTRGNDALLHPFIDSKGNFGKQYSRDMAYAASRYTEVKLDAICAEIFKDIDKNAVDMIDNYDGRMKEPMVFPTTFPNLLVTPNQGIAVGMASQVASFNLKEVCSAAIHYIKDKNCQISKYLLAPDFSTGGQLIYNQAELESIYATGRGGFKIRAKYRYDQKNSCIEITEIPYSTSIEFIIDKITALVKSNKIREIIDVRDETDLNGLRITLDVKRSCNPDHLMHRLFNMTSLCDVFSCNFNFLINKRPRTMGISEILDEWIAFRIECIRRQVTYDIGKKTEKMHLLEGLSLILLDIDKAIRIIRQTEEDSMVLPNLMAGFSIDQLQAEYIAEIKLRNLNKEYILSRTAELDSLRKEICDLKALAGSDEKIKDLICIQLKEISKKYGKPRRTEIIAEEQVQDIPDEVLIEDYGIKLFLTEHSYFKKIALNSLRYSADQKLKDDDSIIQEIETTNKAEIIFFSNKCSAYKAKAYDLADCKASGMGEYLANLLSLEEGERIVYMATTADYSGFMLFAFENGKAAKVNMESYKTNRKKISNAYSDKAKLIFAEKIDEDQEYAFLRNDFKLLAVNSSLIAANATKNTAGVQVINLRKNTFLKKACHCSNLTLENPKYYLADKIPSAGHFINDKERAANAL
ncbi:MAG: topoisomerase IV [Clostridiales bacterium]|nr:topoisomerase IV [Clostridiales bacterium]